MRDHWKEDRLNMHDLGTCGGVLGLNDKGALPTRNFQDGQFEDHEAISGETMRDTILVERGSCFACPVHCKRVVEVDDQEHPVDREYGGPEYETVGSFGSNCGVGDLPAISEANAICNLWAQFALLRVHSSDQNESCRMIHRNSFTFYHIYPEGSSVQKDINDMVIEEIYLINIKNTPVGFSKKTGFQSLHTFPKSTRDVQSTGDPILCGIQREIHKQTGSGKHRKVLPIGNSFPACIALGAWLVRVTLKGAISNYVHTRKQGS